MNHKRTILNLGNINSRMVNGLIVSNNHDKTVVVAIDHCSDATQLQLAGCAVVRTASGPTTALAVCGQWRRTVLPLSLHVYIHKCRLMPDMRGRTAGRHDSVW